MRTPTPTESAASVLLGEPVADWVAARRPGTSWRLIARELYAATDGRIDVTPETLRLWHAQAAGVTTAGEA